MHPRVHHPTPAKVWLYLASALSIAAALVHLIATQLYFGIWAGYGFFFLAAVVTQLAFAIFLWVYPSLWEDRPRRSLLVAGLIGNALIVAMWVVTRTLGVPFGGPNVGQRLRVGFLDVLSVLFELGIIFALVMLLRIYSVLMMKGQIRG